MTTSTVDPWAAPVASGPVRGTVAVPGSKSITNRALLLAAIASDPSTLRRPLLARDTTLMQAALAALGTKFTSGPDRLDVGPMPLRGPVDVDCGLAGTVMRFLPPVAALAEGTVTFDGDERARHRPLGEVLTALRRLGVVLSPGADSLPFTLSGTGAVEGGVVTLDASESSQFVSALLLAGARYRRGLDVRHSGKPIPSTPHILMTIEMLRSRGVDVDDDEPNRWVVSPGTIAGIDTEIEPDLSNTAPFLAAAVVTGGTVTVPRWPLPTTQAGDQLRSIFDAMGARVVLDETGLTITGTAQPSGVDLDLHDVGELAPVVAAVAALADSPSWLRGIAHLRGHETDRLAALSAELRALGCDARETLDGLEIRPRPLTGGLFHCYADHRMAQAGAVLGLVVPGVRLDDVASTAKTYPDFAQVWTALLA